MSFPSDDPSPSERTPDEGSEADNYAGYWGKPIYVTLIFQYSYPCCWLQEAFAVILQNACAQVVQYEHGLKTDISKSPTRTQTVRCFSDR